MSIDRHGVEYPAGFAPPLAGKDAEIVEGYASRYLKVHPYQGRVEAFAPGCFSPSLTSGKAVRFLVDHDETKLVATTRDRLELISDDKGLAFRLGLDDGLMSRAVMASVTDGSRTAMSVGYQVRAADERVIDGVPIRVITEAELTEISLVKRGAVREAFAQLARPDADLRSRTRSRQLESDGAAAGVRRALEGLKRLPALLERSGLEPAYGHPGRVQGYAAIFGSRDGQGDVIERGAFLETLAKRKAAGRGLPPMYLMHGARGGNEHEPIGIWTEMREDSHGLYVEGQLLGLETERGRWNLALLREGGLKGLSIGFAVPPGGARTTAGGRHLSRVHLVEVSLVDEPAHPQAQVVLR